MKLKIYETDKWNLAITNGKITLYTDKNYNLLKIKCDGDWVKKVLKEKEYDTMVNKYIFVDAVEQIYKVAEFLNGNRRMYFWIWFYRKPEKDLQGNEFVLWKKGNKVFVVAPLWNWKEENNFSIDYSWYDFENFFEDFLPYLRIKF